MLVSTVLALYTAYHYFIVVVKQDLVYCSVFLSFDKIEHGVPLVDLHEHNRLKVQTQQHLHCDLKESQRSLVYQPAVAMCIRNTLD